MGSAAYSVGDAAPLHSTGNLPSAVLIALTESKHKIWGRDIVIENVEVLRLG